MAPSQVLPIRNLQQENGRREENESDSVFFNFRPTRLAQDTCLKVTALAGWPSLSVSGSW